MQSRVHSNYQPTTNRQLYEVAKLQTTLQTRALPANSVEHRYSIQTVETKYLPHFH